LSAAGVIAHVPPHAVDATFSAVRGPPNGSVNPLVTAPRRQKLALIGAYTSVVVTLPTPYATSCDVLSATATPGRAAASKAIVIPTTTSLDLCLMRGDLLDLDSCESRPAYPAVGAL
jgi:hypothetical protein